MTHRSTAPTSQGAINWAMVMPLDDASRRRDYIAVSAECAVLASAAKRRLRDLDLDARETRTVTVVRDQFKQAAESLRSGQDVVLAPVVGVTAFRGLSDAVESTGASESPVSTDPTGLAARAERFASIAAMLTAVLEPRHDAEAQSEVQKVIDLFAAASSDLLRNVARAGESVGRPNRRSFV